MWLRKIRWPQRQVLEGILQPGHPQWLLLPEDQSHHWFSLAGFESRVDCRNRVSPSLEHQETQGQLRYFTSPQEFLRSSRNPYLWKIILFLWHPTKGCGEGLWGWTEELQCDELELRTHPKGLQIIPGKEQGRETQAEILLCQCCYRYHECYGRLSGYYSDFNSLCASVKGLWYGQQALSKHCLRKPSEDPHRAGVFIVLTKGKTDFGPMKAQD